MVLHAIAGLLEENNLIERILTPEEQDRLIEASISYLSPIIITALNNGMRRGGILSLKLSEVDFQSNFITVTLSNSKSKKPRRIYINSTLRKLLMEIKFNSGQGEYVFIDNKGNKIKSIRTALKQPVEGHV